MGAPDTAPVMESRQQLAQPAVNAACPLSEWEITRTTRVVAHPQSRTTAVARYRAPARRRDR
jgi:hypothetical protein